MHLSVVVWVRIVVFMYAPFPFLLEEYIKNARITHMCNTHGNNSYFGELEACTTLHPEISRSFRYRCIGIVRVITVFF